MEKIILGNLLICRCICQFFYVICIELIPCSDFEGMVFKEAGVQGAGCDIIVMTV